MTCRENGSCWQGEMDFRRDKGGRNMVDFRLEIKMENQYRIWGEGFYFTFSTFFQLFKSFTSFHNAESPKKVSMTELTLYRHNCIASWDGEYRSSFTDHFLRFYLTEDVPRWRLSLFYSGKRNYYVLGLFKAFIFRENYISDTRTIIGTIYSIFPKPVSKRIHNLMLTSFATCIYLFFTIETINWLTPH